MDKGLPIFTLAKDVISGWFPITKGGKNDIIPFIGKSEEAFLLYCEFHPYILSIERADIDEKFTILYNLEKCNLSPIIIPYEYNGKMHNYYPDFILTLKYGKTIIVELGMYDEKLNAKNLCKSLAAIDYCNKNGWEYWLITDRNILSEKRKNNLLLLKSYDKQMYKISTLQNEIYNFFKNSDKVSIEYATRLLSKDCDITTAQMATYEYIAHRAKQGRLEFDFENEKLKKDSIIKILDENEQILLPPYIHLSYDEIYEAVNTITISNNNDVVPVEKTNARKTIDPESLSDDKQDEFYKRRLAVLEAISSSRKESVKKIAEKYGFKRSTLRHIIDRFLQYGEKGLQAYSTYNGDKVNIDPNLQNSIKKLIHKNPNWKVGRLYNSRELKNEIIQLSKNKQVIVPMPTYSSFYRFMKRIQEEEKNYATNYLTLEERKNGNVKRICDIGSYVSSIEHQLDQVQTDAHWLDIKIVSGDRQYVAGRLWGIAFVDVKTNNVLGHSLSLKSPMEEDYMMALKCTIEPKDKIVNEFKCQNPWICYGIPRVILSDNGKIFTSKRATDVVVRRFNVIEEDAPTYAPDAKGTVESLFKWVVEKLTSRLPGFTKGTDPKKVEKEALEYGITFEEFEKFFVNAIVDSWNIDWDNTRKNSRQVLWENSVKENLANPVWIWDQDELKLFLMKEDRERKVDRHGISFRGRFYQNKTMISGIIGKKVNIRYDKRDISVLYVYLLDGSYYCEVYCNALIGQRLSVWEDEILRNEQNPQKLFYTSNANNNL
ncbi:Mu transposase C-terminal domain-containing protein, partial [Ruminiclostridium cellobioparum]|uniref:Mu transposase C-terminal domain-containing protein n=1 Tax=Ruminiclostridium cellobioparum TaxID=29355 RepID=UPI0028A9A855